MDFFQNQSVTELIFGALITLAFAINRYNTPADQQSARKILEHQSISTFSTRIDNRSSTTAIRFYATLAIYAAIVLAFFLMIACTEIGQSLSSFLSKEGDSVLPPALVATFLITIELAGIPLLSQPEKWTRQFLQTMGRIPYEVYRLREVLNEREVRYEPRKDTKIDGFAGAMEFRVGETTNLPAISKANLQENLVRAKMLIAHTGSWKSHSTFSSFTYDNIIECDGLRAWQERLEKDFLDFCHARAAADKISDLLIGWEKALNEEAKRLLTHVHEFIARAVLKCRFRESRRKRALEDLGFVDVPGTPGLPFRDLVFLFSILLFLYFFAFVIVSKAEDAEMPLGKVLKIAIYVFIPPLLTCHFKDRWKIAKPDETKTGISRRPWPFYLAASILVMLVTLCMSFLIDFSFVRKLGDSLSRVAHTFPWHLISFASTYCLALQLDSLKPEGFSELRFSALQSLIQALVMAVAGLIAVMLLNNLNPPLGEQIYVVPAWYYVATIVGIAGAIIGFFVPRAFREKQTRKPGPGNAK
jgi:hypothetical protein